MNQELPVILLVFGREHSGLEQFKQRISDLFILGEQQGYYRLIVEELGQVESSESLLEKINQYQKELLLIHLTGNRDLLHISNQDSTAQEVFQHSFSFNRKKSKVQTFFIHGDDRTYPHDLFQDLVQEQIHPINPKTYSRTVTVYPKAPIINEANESEAKANFIKSFFKAIEIDSYELGRSERTLESASRATILKDVNVVCIQFRLYSSTWWMYLEEFMPWFLEEFADEKKLDPNGPDFIFFFNWVYDEAWSVGMLGKFGRRPKPNLPEALKAFSKIIVLPEQGPLIPAKTPVILEVLQNCSSLKLIVSSHQSMTSGEVSERNEELGIPTVIGQLEHPYGELEYEQIFEFYRHLFQQKTLREAFSQAEFTTVNKLEQVWELKIPDRRQEDWTLPFSIQTGKGDISRPTVFLIFSNQKEYTHFGKELGEIRLALEPIEMKGLSNTFFEISYEPKRSLDKMYKAFEEYNEKTYIPIFHLGGFTDSLFSEKTISTEKSSSDTLVNFLGHHSDLKLVFLSGSGTKEQVNQLLEAGVPAVIATFSTIDNTLAVRIASRFYDQLARGNTLRVAWETAEAEAKTNFDSFQGKTGRKSITKNISIEETEAFPWGLYLREENQEDILQWRLVPKQGEDLEASSSSYQINQVLIDQIQEGIATYHPAILERIASENLAPQEVFSLLRNAFPYPISESLRKLISTNSQALDESRLDQLLTTYHTAIELYISILFAQLYELKQRNPEAVGVLDPSLRAFFQIRYGIEAHQYLSLLADLQRTFSSVPKEELPFPACQQFLDQLEEDSPVVRACSRLYEIKDEWEESKMAKASFFENKIPDYCKSTEEDLGLILKELSFLSQYVFSSVGHIFVEQHYLTGPPLYQHEVVSWNNPNSPALDMRTRRQSASTLLHSQSVYLMQDIEGLEPVLPLSPLLMMMDHEPSGRSESHQLYQFSHIHPSDDEFYIKSSANPTDMIAISAESDPERYAQAEAFAQLMFGCSVWELRGGGESGASVLGRPSFG